jgi:hypothetical protein
MPKLAARLHLGVGQAPQLKQFQPESLNLGEDAVQCGLVRNRTLQKGVAALDLGM